MDPTENRETIQQFIKLLEQNGRQGQTQDLSQLLEYIDGMNRQFDAVFQELQEVKAQLAQEQQPAVKKVMEGVATNLENKLEWARNILSGLGEKIAECAKNAIDNFRETGVSALDRAVSAMGIKNVLESLQKHLSGMIADTKQNIEKLENVGHELRSVGGHLKNAGRAMLGKETQAVDGGQGGRFQSVVLAPMRATQKLLSGMNRATQAAIGGMGHLEQTAEAAREHKAERIAKKPKRLAKKPSIRQLLAEKKAEAAARAAPAPEKEHRATETIL